MINRLFILFFILTNVCLAQAQTETTAGKLFSLDQAIDFAYANNINIKNAMLNITDAEQQIFERRAIGLPQVNGELNYQHFPQVPQMALPEEFVNLSRDPVTGELPPGFSREVSFQLKNTFTASISASSLVFDGTYLTGLRAARVYKKYVQEDLLAQKQVVKNQVIEAYLPSLLIDESLNIIDKNIGNIQQLLKETKALYNEGFVEQLDVDRLELSLANLLSERDNLVRQRKTALNALKFTMGYPENEAIALDDDIQSLLAKSADDLVDEFTLSDRPEYRVANVGLELNELNIEQYKKGYLPNVAAFANYQYLYQGDNFKDGFWAPTFVVGAQVNVPIFDGFDKRSKIERAEIDLLKNQNQTRLLEQSIRLEIQNAQIALENAQNRVQNQQKNLDLAEKIYNTTQIKYREGVGSSLEIAQAEQSLFQAQQNYITALYDLAAAKIDLARAVGK